jgi:hypothetical protein
LVILRGGRSFVAFLNRLVTPLYPSAARRLDHCLSKISRPGFLGAILLKNYF